jgi:N-acetylglucosaminyldiphosphoundecaprenol N-acetyl-beta-D-mannosaminyltransferase
MARHIGRIDAPLLIGVGAAFDFHAGLKPWAPRLVRKLGCEWAFRLACEPHRLWRRNLNSPLFVLGVLWERFGVPAMLASWRQRRA